ncbi:MAG: tripartite tricarboxylate transporter TctB family protein [Beijerinckiaceae bacterium]
MSHETEDAEERPLVNYRTMEIAVAVFFLIVSAIVIKDSIRLGFGWKPNEGPAPGYFPFYIAVVMTIASLINLWRALPYNASGVRTMVTREGFKRMATIFVPAIVYVGAIHVIGIYVASAIYIAGFMYLIGKFSILKCIAVAGGIALVSFMMFEVWFLVPLPKGPLEAALGY